MIHTHEGLFDWLKAVFTEGSYVTGGTEEQ